MPSNILSHPAAKPLFQTRLHALTLETEWRTDINRPHEEVS